jgi:predicted transcriptional regulator
MRVLLSIKPAHAANILSGLKTFEFRRRIFARRDIRTVLIYCTMPVGRLVGEFDITGILEGEPEHVWASTCHGSGIRKSYFDAYFDGRLRAYALQIGEVRPFGEPVSPSELFANFTPPQSYMYVKSDRTEAASRRQLALL